MEVQPSSSNPGKIPVAHKSFSLNIKGNKTDVVISKYEDSFLVVVTQIGCMGTILHARRDEGQANISTEPVFHVGVIFGKRDEVLLESCARQLMEHISSCGSNKQLVLSLGLKDHSTGTLKEIIFAIIENKLW
ncbi:hypothetical protein LUZ60_012423 [Juncus effusus]|nr:hypothetical protein LUZ60_012423 [Juncus effusus]